MRRLALLLLLGATPAAAAAGSLSKAEALVFVATAADLISTEYALSRLGARAEEGNPLMARRGVRIGTNFAMAAGIIWASRSLKARGHDRLGALALWAPIVVKSSVTGWNLYLTHSVSW